YGLTRDEQDTYALTSHRKATAAMAAKRFAAELAPVEVSTKRGSSFVAADEGPRTETSIDALSALRPAFRPGGSVTACSASDFNDGAVGVLVAAGEYVKAHGPAPLGWLVASSGAGVPPRVMGTVPVPASRMARERAGITLAD